MDRTHDGKRSRRRQKAKHEKNKHTKQEHPNGPAVGKELADAIKYLVGNISKSFIVSWYGIVSETNHDFVAGVDALMETILVKISNNCSRSLNKYRTSLILTQLLHEHIFNSTDETAQQTHDEETDEFKTCEEIVTRLYNLVDCMELNRIKRTALYNLLIGVVTQSVVLPIIDRVTSPRWLFALLVWYCEFHADDTRDMIDHSSNNNNVVDQRSATNNETLRNRQAISSVAGHNFTNPMSTIEQQQLGGQVPKSMSSAIAWLGDLQKNTLQLHICAQTNHIKTRLERVLDAKANLSVDDLRSILRNRYGHYVDMSRRRPYPGFDEHRSSKFKTLGAIGSPGVSTNIGRLAATSATYDTYAFRASYDDRFNRTDNQTRSKFYTIDSYSNLGSRFVSLIASTQSEMSSSSSSSSTSLSSSQLDGEDEKERFYDSQCDAAWSRGQHSDDCPPIASRFMEIIHYAISGNVECSSTRCHSMAKSLLGTTVEKYIESYLIESINEQNAAHCINGITSSIWPDDNHCLPELDMTKGTVEQATQAIVQLIERRHLNCRLLPLGRLLRPLLVKLVTFHLQQVESQPRNKAFVYAFLKEIISDLES